jgi:hypothetical protein
MVDNDPIWSGTGQVFRRDKNRELLCSCTYRLTEGRDRGARFGRSQYLAGQAGDIRGTLMPTPPITLSVLLSEKDKSDTLQLRLQSGHWLDFLMDRSGQVIGSGGLRGER